MRFTYISDSGYIPYGKTPALQLRARIETIFESAVQTFGVDGLVIACNAASTVFMSQRQCMRMPLYNVIQPTVDFMRASRFNDIGIIGGVRTIESAVYSKGIGHSQMVREVSAQPLSALIEDGLVSGPIVTSVLRRILAPFIEDSVEALVLACTHYPAAAPTISCLLPGVALIDPAEILAQEMAYVEFGVGMGNFVTTGDPERSRCSARLAFGMEIPKFYCWSSTKLELASS
jgi:glutamate racemase